MSSQASSSFDPRRLLIKSPARRSGYTVIASPSNSVLRWITFGRLILNAEHRTHHCTTDENELVFDLFSGGCTVHVEHAGAKSSFPLGARGGAFDGAPPMLYVPAGAAVSVELSAGSDGAEAALFFAPGRQSRSGPVAVDRGQVMTKLVGRDNWTRKVTTPIGDNVAAQTLIVGETVNPPGNWSSAPPHKHDRHNPPGEGVMEEVYYFQMKPAQGFGFMRVYTGEGDAQPFDEAFVVEDGDTVLIPRGYHPVVAGPGYELHYTWALAGEERRYGAWSDDPKHAWVKG